MSKLDTAKTALNDLIVAIRGGGDLNAAADAAQTTLDELNAEDETEETTDGTEAAEDDTAEEKAADSE